MLFLGAGAKVWGYNNALLCGFIFAALIIPVFAFRHYGQDGGKFPPEALAELGLKHGELGERKAECGHTLRYCWSYRYNLAKWYFQLPA